MTARGAKTPGLSPAGTDRQVGNILLWALRQPVVAREMPPLAQGVSGALVQRAVEHGVACLLHEALRKYDFVDKVGPSFMAVLGRLRFDAAARHLLGSADLRTLASALGRADIPWVVMKGPVLAALGYGDASLRWTCDVDVLVGPQQFSRAIDALVCVGTTLLDVNWDLQLSLWRSEATLRLPLGTTLDLHWHPVNDARARALTLLDTEDLLSRRRLIPGQDGFPLPALDPVDNLITVALHASLSGGHRLIWAKDLERLCHKDEPDWEEVVRRASEGKVGPPVGIMLHRAQRLLGASVPADLVRRLTGRQPVTGLFRLGERLASPSTLGRGSHTGIAFLSSLRGTPAESVSALTRTWGLQVAAMGRRATRRRSDISPSANPLRRPSQDSRSRERYLEAVRDHSNEALRRRLLSTQRLER